ncbi:MAG: type II toxin-antitoxin system VapC family toxin [Anaerolineae bacterium]|nr:type II toxin-antitoxin system VapC family toxin [Anaerolineae bacterium]
MTTRSSNRIFVDTNILIYASVPTSPLHAQAVSRLRSLRRSGSELWISRQTLREYMSVVTRPQTFIKPYSPTGLVGQIRRFQQRFEIAEDNSRVMSALLKLLDYPGAQGKQVFDANIIATMQVYKIDGLLTHNIADFKRFAGIITLIPLQPTI